MFAIDAIVCDTNKWLTVKFSTPQQAIEYINRNGMRMAFNPTDDQYKELPIEVYNVLYPECAHGLAAWLCADPVSHYPRDL